MKKKIIFLFFLFLYSCGSLLSISGNIIKTPLLNHHYFLGSGTGFIDSKTTYSPGDTLEIKPGIYSFMAFYNLKGSSDSPIVIMNGPGEVEVNITNMHFTNCNFVHLTGTGDSNNYFYGFKNKGGSFAFQVDGRSSNFEIDHCFADSSAIGFAIKNYPSCMDSTTWGGSFIMDNFYLHDNIIVGTKYEGHYIGPTHPVKGYQLNCSGVLKRIREFQMGDIRIAHEIVLGTMNTGIQVSNSIIGKMDVDSNIVIGCGRIHQDGFNMGIAGGSSNDFECYHNTIIGSDYGIQFTGDGVCNIYNNYIRNINKSGIIISDENPAPDELDSLLCNIFDNKLDSLGNQGIYFQNYNGRTLGLSKLNYNNIITRTPINFQLVGKPIAANSAVTHQASGSLNSKGYQPPADSLYLSSTKQKNYPDSIILFFPDSTYKTYKL